LYPYPYQDKIQAVDVTQSYSTTNCKLGENENKKVFTTSQTPIPPPHGKYTSYLIWVGIGSVIIIQDTGVSLSPFNTSFKFPVLSLKKVG
jgi:hypothetical protein